MHVKGSPHVLSFSADSTRVTAIGDSRHLDVWDPTVDSAPFFVGLDISFRWLPGTHTVVYGGSDGQAALYDTPTPAVQRGVNLPCTPIPAQETSTSPPSMAKLALFPGHRFIGQTHHGAPTRSTRPTGSPTSK